MSLSYTVKELLAALETITVTNGDGNSDTLLARLYNNQPERRAAGTGYDYKCPAAFVELITGDHEALGGGVMGKDLKIRILLESIRYNVEGALDQDLTIYDLKDKVHRKLNGLKLPSLAPLMQSDEGFDVNHENTYLKTMEYSTHFTDLTGSLYDEFSELYIEETLTNPMLVLGDTLPDAISENTTPFYEVEIAEYITSLTVAANAADLTVTINSAVFIDNSGAGEVVAFYIDWGDGNFEDITIGVPLRHTYEDNTKTLPVLIQGLFGGSLDMDIYIDGSGEVVDFFSGYTASVAYDLPPVMQVNMPIGITSKANISGTMTAYTVKDVNTDTIINYDSRELDSYNYLGVINFSDNSISTNYTYRGGVSGNSLTLTNTILLNLKTI